MHGPREGWLSFLKMCTLSFKVVPPLPTACLVNIRVHEAAAIDMDAYRKHKEQLETGTMKRRRGCWNT
jgi:hypothetical protein